MTHDQLLAFITVVSEGTFSAASRVLHKTQPAVSKLVANLEADLNLTLLDRSGYRPSLTDAGQRFHARARRLVSETESLRSFGLQLSQTPEPRVRLVLEAVTPLPRVIPVLQRIQTRFPTVRVSLQTERLGGVIEALHEGRADLAVASMRGAEVRGVDAQPLCGVRVVPVVGVEHPLARAPSPVAAELLREHPQIVLRDSGSAEFAHDVNLLEGGRRWSVTDVMAKLQLIEAGMGWGGLPEHVVHDALADGRVVALDVREFEVDVIALSTLRRRERSLGVVAQALWQQLGTRRGDDG